MFLRDVFTAIVVVLLKLLSTECGEKAFLILGQSVLKISGYFAQVKFL